MTPFKSSGLDCCPWYHLSFNVNVPAIWVHQVTGLLTHSHDRGQYIEYKKSIYMCIYIYTCIYIYIYIFACPCMAYAYNMFGELQLPEAARCKEQGRWLAVGHRASTERCREPAKLCCTFGGATLGWLDCGSWMVLAATFGWFHGISWGYHGYQIGYWWNIYRIDSNGYFDAGI